MTRTFQISYKTHIKPKIHLLDNSIINKQFNICFYFVSCANINNISTENLKHLNQKKKY